jgi:hypothetical protein
MIGFEVEIDGDMVVTAGVEDWSILALHVDAHRLDYGSTSEKAQMEFCVGGLTVTNQEGVRYHFRWPEKELNIGSVIRVRVIETTSADAPTKRYRSDASIQESPFTEDEQRDMRYKDYLSLKAEFEPDHG